MQEKSSSCQICTAMCGMTITLDDDDRIVSLRGDRSHPISRGFACSKGLAAPELLNSEDRLLHPMKRMEDGRFEPIALDMALDQIADRLRVVLDENGPVAVGLFKGTQTYPNSTASQMIVDWMAALGSPNYYTTFTIDQSSHLVTMDRMGRWGAGKQKLEDSDVAIMIGTNPLVSSGAYGLLDFDPVRRLKEAKQRGLKLIVIDPRRTETAMQADCFLQPVPGEDPTIMAGLIRLILENGWQDRDFCNRYADGVEQVKAAVASFTPAYVERRAGVPAEQLITAAQLFARDGKRGIAVNGTGAAMSPRSNLTDHLVETLNVLCGRFIRAGERVVNPGVVMPSREIRAEVIPGGRSWEIGPKSFTGHGAIFGERMSGILADEMLRPDEERIRALFVNGANPAVALPDQLKAVEALESLDLLVSVEPLMTATALLSDYIIPPLLMYERENVLKSGPLEAFDSGPPFNQYLPKIAEPPADAEVIDDWYLYWALAKRLGLRLSYAGTPMDLDAAPPSTRQLLDIQYRDARIPLDTLREYPLGNVFQPDPPLLVQPGDVTHRFALAPQDILSEIAEVVREGASVEPSEDFPFRLIVRRMRSMQNSLGRNFRETRRRSPYNPLFVHPDDLLALRLDSGDRVTVQGELDWIPAIVQPDPTLRRGVVSMTHCWGSLPEDDYERVGVATSRLVRTDIRVEKINAMPAMSSIPVRLEKVLDGSERRQPGSTAVTTSNLAAPSSSTPLSCAPLAD